jgi:hypothetical protein
MTPESRNMTTVRTFERKAVNYTAVSINRLMLKSTLQIEDGEVDWSQAVRGNVLCGLM